MDKETDQPLSIEVKRPLDVEVDLGHLLVSDPNEVSAHQLKSNPKKYLHALARDNTQLLINKIWTLPFERADDVVITKLPKPTYILPREKPAPKPRPLTKWEQYAKEKGIKKQKKTKLVWDELVQQWVPRFGYRKNALQEQKDWLLEVPQHADPYEDQFEKKSETKSEKVAKNELQRLRNIAKSRKVTVPAAGLATSTGKKSKEEMVKSFNVAKTATASLGKFQDTLPKEKVLGKKTGKKRSFDPYAQPANYEKEKNLSVLEKVLSKKPKMNLEKAVNQQMQVDRSTEAEERRSSRNKQGKGNKRRSGNLRKGGRGGPSSSNTGGGGRGGGARRGRSGSKRGRGSR